MKKLIDQINALVDAIKADIDKSETNKAAAARVARQLSILKKLVRSSVRHQLLLQRSNLTSKAPYKESSRMALYAVETHYFNYI